MKEIDKIRIRQWNQDNPYIQMKNLENAQPGYRVHTVNDDHHLYELPLETQNIILDWVFWNFYPAQKIYPHLTSDDLKEVLYKRTQIHLHNNQFKEAMLINGFWPRDPSELNWVFHIQASSPAIRTQADGYPGIPIIGRQELNEYRKKSGNLLSVRKLLRIQLKLHRKKKYPDIERNCIVMKKSRMMIII